jgi:hypothetical protein
MYIENANINAANSSNNQNSNKPVNSKNIRSASIWMKITQSEIKTITNIDLEFTMCIPNWIEMTYSDGFFETSYASQDKKFWKSALCARWAHLKMIQQKFKVWVRFSGNAENNTRYWLHQTFRRLYISLWKGTY